MKIKDVISETGLTDRAIRLYIENGLVSPECKESYNGRKNIDFSVEDVTELNNIAILRKAGFSINEIKLLRLDGDSCKRTLTEFTTRISQRIENDSRVLEKLKAVAASESITIQSICDSLNSITKEKQIPETDINLSFAEKLEKKFFLFLASAGLIYIFGCILYVVLLCKFNFRYIYPTVLAFDLDFYIKLSIVIFVVISCIYLLHTYRKRVLFTGRIKRLIVNILISVVSVFLSLVFFFFTIDSVFTPNACSKTTAPKNYMVLDNGADTDEVKNFFPAEIDSYATYHHSVNDLLLQLPDTYPESTKYYYKYFNEFFGGDVFREIIAEWRPLDEYKEFDDYNEFYKKHKEKYLNTDFGKPVTIKMRGDWQCIYYDDSSEDNWNKNYIYRIFAYNDKTETVRFIYAERRIKDPIEEGGEIIPDFPELEW